MFQHSIYPIYHPDHPDKVVTIEAIEERGARIKARKILSKLGVMDKEEHWNNLKVKA